MDQTVFRKSVRLEHEYSTGDKFATAIDDESVVLEIKQGDGDCASITLPLNEAFDLLEELLTQIEGTTGSTSTDCSNETVED